MFLCHPLPSYLLLVTVILATSGRGASLCHQDQSAALIRLKASFRFNFASSTCPSFPPEGTTLSSWKVDTDCCTWEGVTCEGTSGYVTSLDLSYLCISGNLSSPDIFQLTSLRSLYLSYNNFDGSPWPSSGLEQLTNLRYLDLSYSGLSGNVPVEKGQLSNLVTLYLSGLDLKYLSLKILIDNLVGLQNLYLDEVNISVSPTDLAHGSSTNTTTGLKELRIRWWTITGGRSDTVLTNLLLHPKLANLVTLELYYLDLKSSSLHTLIDNLGNLQKLYLDSVNISVSPTDLAHASSTNKMPGLEELSMTGCMITGRIDIALTKFRFLSKLTLDGTHFSGPAPVPKRFVEFSSLAVLSLQNCGLTRTTFPSWIFHIKSLMSLDASGNENLCGELPEFIQGSALQVLIFSGTKLSGRIPESIGNLRNLTVLDLSYCQFHGPIPPFAQWPKIEMVQLSSNNLNGSLPTDGYLSLHNLTSVYLRNNLISGVIPASLFSHPSLMDLDLAQNNFTGNFLLYPTVSSSLRSIDLSFNKLQGPLPKLLSKFVELEWLDVSSNNLTGSVDLSFIKNYEMPSLSLSHNKLSVVEEDVNHSYFEYPAIGRLGLASCNLSSVPKFLMHQRSISDLDLSNNNIGGHIPDWIWGMGVLSLNLSHNLFTSINTNLSNTSISDLDLHSNKIEGALPLPPSGTDRLDYSNNHFNSSIMPEFWSHVSSTNSLSLANNSFTGEISHLICKASHIEVLDLSFNNFSGLIPPCLLKRNKHLEILNLRGNNFHGSLPQYITEECALQIIDFNGNKLEGKLPVSIINCHLLQVLDLGNNLIVDTYPEWLGVLPLLKVLVLKSNGFHGPIDYYRMNKQTHTLFPELQVLDLSSNSFNGTIPARFLKQFKAMMVVSSGAPSMYVGIIESSSAAASPSSHRNYKESITVTLKGQQTTLVQILSVFMYIDLSNNNFEGVIPNEIGDLKLLKQLNLSRNSFTGVIPPRIANMLQLESLDLSYNQLSGEIPPAMAAMSFLEVLNLSYNHLSGQIPQSSQFLTFPTTSFLGNDGLCGKPLRRLCDINHAPSAPATSGSSKELNWEILSVEVGVISGLAIVVATMLLWGNGRRWVYFHVDKFWLLVLQPWICRRRC